MGAVETLSENIICQEGEHHYEVTLKKQADAEEAGLRLYVCSVCGDDYEEIIPSSGHVWSEWEERKAATCMEVGERVRHCVNCDQPNATMVESIEETEHLLSKWEEVRKEHPGEQFISRSCLYGCGYTEVGLGEGIIERKTQISPRIAYLSRKPRRDFSVADAAVISGNGLIFLFFVFLITSDIYLIRWHSKTKARNRMQGKEVSGSG